MTTITPEEWERRFKAHIVSVLFDEPDETVWTREEAEASAQDEFDGAGFEFLSEGFEEDPEGSAEEALSYWIDGADLEDFS